MFKAILLAIFTVATITTSAQIPPANVKPKPMKEMDTLKQLLTNRSATYKKLTDNENEQVVYLGTFSYRDLETEPTFSWLTKNYDEYTPNTQVISALQPLLSKHSILIFMGTWCSDSHLIIPRLYKVLNDCNINWQSLVLIGMDRPKTTETPEAQELVKRYEVSMLPTIILTDHNGNEIGRITESLNKSVEEDLLAILLKKH